jgi:hypothetical protein
MRNMRGGVAQVLGRTLPAITERISPFPTPNKSITDEPPEHKNAPGSHSLKFKATVSGEGLAQNGINTMDAMA